MLVQQILKSKGNDAVFTITPGTAVSDAAVTLSDNRIGALIVAEADGAVVGVLSERDIVRNLGKRGPACLQDKVDDMMTRDPVCATRQDTDESVVQRMTDGRFRHMPVLDDGKLIGVVTLGDVVKARLAELAMENESMQGMIMGR
ncbi:MAG TPA: CBS domain-containing protein [Roseovarius sp.]